MGQQPNIELKIEDLPRPTPHVAPARRWVPQRPGDLHAPADVPWGGKYGTPGPDTGYALALIGARDLPVSPGERGDVDAALTAIVSARSSTFGRAPTVYDVDMAVLLLGLDPGRLPDEVAARLAAARPGWVSGAGHDHTVGRRLVAAIPRDVLTASRDDLARRLSAGERLLLS
jgi:hypothetical protein